jgi:hypothetical protein
MSADFEKVLVKDSRLDVTDSIKYAVIKGGQNVTMARYKAISETDNQIVFNIQVPSEQTIIDRRVLLQTELSLDITSVGADGCYYGVTSALASFPLHQLMTVLSATINNNTVSVNVRDVLPAIIRLLDCDDLVNFNSSSPTFADTMISYSESVVGAGISHPNQCYFAVNETSVIHRGSFSPLTYAITAAVDGKRTESFTWLLTEPLLLSPFFFSNLKSNSQGFYGIQNMNIVVNVGNTSRVFRGQSGVNGAASQTNPSPVDADGQIVAVASSQLFTNSYLLFNFLTPHPSDMLPARNIVPFYELPRYITPYTAAVRGYNCTEAGVYTAGLGVSSSKFTIRTNSLQLNQIPDKLILYVRKTQQSLSWGDSDVGFPIENIVINFNNNSGILASALQVDLWQMSRNNGVKSNWNDWKGFAVNIDSQASAIASSVGTHGSYLVLEFGKDIQLTEDFYACGSLGNFNLQMDITCVNNRPYNLSGANNVEAVLITMNSGVFVCERGTSSTYTGILTKQDVLEASQQDHYTHDDVKRLVGGGFFDSIKSGLSHLGKKGLEYGKKQLAKHGPKLMEKGKKYLMKKGKAALSKYMGNDDEEEEEE